MKWISQHNIYCVKLGFSLSLKAYENHKQE